MLGKRGGGGQIRFLHACLTFAGLHLIGTSKYTFRVVHFVSFQDYIELGALSRTRDNFEQSKAPGCKIFKIISMVFL